VFVQLAIARAEREAELEHRQAVEIDRREAQG
jgi:hypothetical protein